MKSVAIFCALALGIACIKAQTTGQAAQQAAASGVPEQCISSATGLFGACQGDINKAFSSVGVPGATSGDIGSLLSAVNAVQAAGKTDAALAALNPGTECCGAAKTFNDANCGCEPEVLNLVRSVTNADEATAAKVVNTLAQKCGLSPKSLVTGGC